MAIVGRTVGTLVRIADVSTNAGCHTSPPCRPARWPLSRSSQALRARLSRPPWTTTCVMTNRRRPSHGGIRTNAVNPPLSSFNRVRLLSPRILGTRALTTRAGALVSRCADSDRDVVAAARRTDTPPHSPTEPDIVCLPTCDLSLGRMASRARNKTARQLGRDRCWRHCRQSRLLGRRAEGRFDAPATASVQSPEPADGASSSRR